MRDKNLVEAAEHFGVSPRAITYWVRAGAPCDFKVPDRKHHAIFDLEELAIWRKNVEIIKGPAPAHVPPNAIAAELIAERMGVNKTALARWIRQGAPVYFRFPGRKTRRDPHMILEEVKAWHKRWLKERAELTAAPLPEGALPLKKAAPKVGLSYDRLVKWTHVEGTPVYYKWPHRRGSRKGPHVIPKEFKQWLRDRDRPVDAPEDAIKISDAAKKMGMSLANILRMIREGAPHYGWRPTFVSVEELNMWRQRQRLRRCDDCGIPYTARKTRWPVQRCAACSEKHRKRHGQVASERYRNKKKQAKLSERQNASLQSQQAVPTDSHSQEWRGSDQEDHPGERRQEDHRCDRAG